jgi:hypothetical protein
LLAAWGIPEAIDMNDLAHYIANWTDLPVVEPHGVSGLFTVNPEGREPLRRPPHNLYDPRACYALGIRVDSFLAVVLCSAWSDGQGSEGVSERRFG